MLSKWSFHLVLKNTKVRHFAVEKEWNKLPNRCGGGRSIFGNSQNNECFFREEQKKPIKVGSKAVTSRLHNVSIYVQNIKLPDFKQTNKHAAVLRQILRVVIWRFSLGSSSRKHRQVNHFRLFCIKRLHLLKYKI